MRGKDGIRWEFVLFVMFLFLCSVSSTADIEGSVDQSGASDIGNNENVNRIAGTPHDPIAIDGDNNFSDTVLAEGWDGDGSEELPYIIEGFDIDLGGASGYCILVNNTRAHFKIRNCQLLGASVSPFAGVYLRNVTNAVVADSDISSNYYGIYLWHSNSTFIKNTTFTNNNWGGIYAYYSHMNVLSDNYFTNNAAFGFYYEYSDGITATNNTCVDNHYNIYITGGNGHLIYNNTCFSTTGMNMGGITVYSTEGSQVISNNCTNNGGGIDINGFVSGNVTDNICKGNSFTGMGVGASFSNVANNEIRENLGQGLTISLISGTMLNNTVIDNEWGIAFSGTLSRIEDNNCSSNTYYGLSLQGWTFNNVTENTCWGNGEEGIYLQSSEFFILSGNNCSFNTEYGIHTFQSYNCSLIDNTCDFNGINGIHLDTSISNNLTENSCFSNSGVGLYVGGSDLDKFESNTCNGNNVGIQLSGATLSILFNNTCEYNLDTGILLSSSDECSLLNNTCIDNLNIAVHVSNAMPLLVGNNTCIRSDFGLYLEGVSDATVTSNTFQDCGLFLTFNPLMVGYFTVTDNTVNSRPLVVAQGLSGSIIPGGAGQIILISCYMVDVVNQNLSSTTVGLLILDSNEVGVRDCFFSKSYYGIFAAGSDTVYADHNVFSRNGYGISLNDNYNSVPSFGFVEWNVFFDNYIANAEDTSSFPSSFDYNYWSDYTGVDDNSDGFGDTPYTFTGNSDPHPCMYNPIPPEWLEPLTDKYVEYDFTMLGFQYDLNLTSPAPMLWSLNTTLFFIDSDGIVTLDSYLPIGAFGLEVTVSSPYGHVLVGAFNIHIVDSTIPSWVSIPTNQSLLWGEQLDIEVSIVDLSGISHWEINDTVNFRLTATYFDTSSIAYITSTTNLDPGVYGVLVLGYDIYDNSVSAEFTVMVETETTTPVWVLAPIDEAVEYGEPYVQRLGVYDSSSIAYWWLNDTTHFTIDEQGVIRNATVLEPGIYRLEVRAYDPFDNYCNATLVITVLDPPITTTITTTTTTTTSTSTTTTTPTNTTNSVPGGPDPILMFGVGGGVGAVAVVVIIFLFMKKKS